jgi:CRISP-associated protein Cas1
VRDRIVQQALLQVLHPLMEPQFEPSSFAYRPGKSHLMAVRQVAKWRDQGYDWVLDADIVNYFSNIEHGRLVNELQERLDAPWVVDLIRAWVEVGVLTQAGLVLPQKGVPQGAVVSPLLANIYLDDFDEQLAALGHKLVRYADDFVVLSRSEQQLIAGRAAVSRLLDEAGLILHPDKTRMTDFDKGFRFLGHGFAGDLIVPLKRKRKGEGGGRKKEREEREVRLVHAEPNVGPTEMQLALLAALKDRQQPIPPPLYAVLGYRVRRDDRPVEIASASTGIQHSWRSGMSSLYVMQQGTYLQKEQGRFVLKPPQGEVLEIPIREVDRILLFGNVQLSTAVIGSCLQLKIPVLFLSQMGDYKGHLWSDESPDLVVETAQFERQKEMAFKVAVAGAMVRGKLMNSKQLLLRLKRDDSHPAVMGAILRLLDTVRAMDGLANTLTLEQIRGYEGFGAAQYFAALNYLIRNEGFSLPKRAFHPPPDPMNSLLSFGYTLLLNNVFSLLIAEGLNPYLGNLHGAERTKAYLAFDVMEEFRSPIVDTLVMKLVNKKAIRPTDFTWPTDEGGVYLTGTARRLFLKRFEERMGETASHPDIQGPVSYRRIIQLQVKRYVKSLLGNQPYEAFRRII